MTAGWRMVKWAMALTLLVGFLLSFFMEITGLTWHQWLGLGIGVLAACHGWIHRSWVVSVLRPRPGAKAGQGRRLLAVDGLLLLGIAVHVTSGVLISTWLDLSLARSVAWIHLHIYASLITLGLVVVKVGLHWRWIVMATKARIESVARWLEGDDAPAAAPRQPAAPGRREFLGLMGMVGLAAILAGARSLRAVLEDSEDATLSGAASHGVASLADAVVGSSSRAAEAAPAEPAASTEASSSFVGADSAAACSVQCGNRCSYPGRCHRYSDEDGNGRCDWGECI